jgi:hypothetical protein
MNKPLLVLQAPIFTRSGYGDHSRDILRSLFKMDKYDVKIVPTAWGNTPQNQIEPNTEFGKTVFANVITKTDRKPDIFIQISVANEFEPKGNYNIGITAGVETTLIPKEFVDGSNKMDLIIVPSEFTKGIMKNTKYQETNKQTQQVLREFKIEKPIEVLFEGVDITTFLPNKEKVDVLGKLVDTDFNFLFVGHWLKGDLGEDRKNISMLIKTFSATFKHIKVEKRPGLILKTSHAGFSITDRETIINKIESCINEVGEDRPKIYLLHGDLTNSEMSDLYNHPKVNAMVSFTKGEGYGRPLAEFSLTGKPLLVSNWSGHTDFLKDEHTILLSGNLTPVHKSAADKFLMEQSKWFTVDYSNAANTMYKVFDKYDTYLKKSKGSESYIKNNFSLDKMDEVFVELMDKYVPNTPKIVPFNLPKLNKNKMKIPTLNKK